MQCVARARTLPKNIDRDGGVVMTAVFPGCFTPLRLPRPKPYAFEFTLESYPGEEGYYWLNLAFVLRLTLSDLEGADDVLRSVGECFYHRNPLY